MNDRMPKDGGPYAPKGMQSGVVNKDNKTDTKVSEVTGPVYPQKCPTNY